MNPVAVTAFKEIASFEILLRRFIRWQLMSQFGRAWLVEIGDDMFNTVERRIQAEKNQGLYWSKASELSFLSMSELIVFIFTKLWTNSAREVLNADYGLRKALHSTIVPLRNKIAHFRAIDISDLELLKYAAELRAILSSYYSNQSRVTAHMSSDLQLLDEQIEPAVENEIKEALASSGVDYFWTEYGKFEGIRAKNVSPGLGIYDKNVFLELNFIERDAPETCLNSWFESNKFLISSIVVDKSKIRVFFPCKTSSVDAKKLLSSLYRHVSSYVPGNKQEPNMLINEYILNTRMETPVGLAF